MPSSVRDDEERRLIGDPDFEEDLRCPESGLLDAALAFDFDTGLFLALATADVDF
jgi:hypothetical protein